MDKKISLLKELNPSFNICLKKKNKRLKKYIEKRMTLEENIKLVKKENNKINKRFYIYLKKYPDTFLNKEKMDSISFLKENSIKELKEKYNFKDEDLNKKSTLKRISKDFYIFEYSNSDKLIIKEERYSDNINEEWICKNLAKEENIDNIGNNKLVTYSYIPKSKNK